MTRELVTVAAVAGELTATETGAMLVLVEPERLFVPTLEAWRAAAWREVRPESMVDDLLDGDGRFWCWDLPERVTIEEIGRLV